MEAITFELLNNKAEEFRNRGVRRVVISSNEYLARKNWSLVLFSRLFKKEDFDLITWEVVSSMGEGEIIFREG